MDAPAMPLPPARLRRALVTGHTGFIGGRLAGRLRSLGVEVTGASRSAGFDLLKDPLPLAGVGHVYHVAGQAFVPRSWSDPAAFYEVNAVGTVRLLDQCRRAGVPVTYVSGYVYGQPERLPIAESMPARPNNPYAFSKLAGEEACRFFNQAYGLPVVILRPFNVYGPGQDASFLIPTIARQAADPAVAEIVVADLEPRRDFVHVDDVVDALLLAPDLPPARPFNVGSGRSWSVQDVIEACLAGCRARKPYRGRGERRGNEIIDVVADISALTAASTWRPRVDFSTGIASVLDRLQP